MQAGASVASSSFAALATGGATITDGDATVDFSSDPSTSGHTGVVQHITSPDLDAAAAETQGALRADLSEPTSLRVSIAVAPAVDTIHVTLNTGTAFTALASGSAPVIYVWSDSDQPDGAPDFQPLNTTYDPVASTLEADIPRSAFSNDSSLTDVTLGYTAVLRTGVAQTSAIAAPGVADLRSIVKSALGVGPGGATKQSGTSGSGLITCPLQEWGCTERSMFNPLRQRFGTSTHARPHHGVDLDASPRGTEIPNVYSIPNGKIVPVSRSLEWFTANEPSLRPASRAAGVEILVEATVNGTPVGLKYLHLQDVAGYLKNSTSPTAASDPNQGLLANSVVAADGLIGTTGNTGSTASGPGPLLHFELYLNVGLACRKSATGSTCSYVAAAVDPFPYLVSRFIMAQAQQSSSTVFFGEIARDSVGNSIASRVSGALEITQDFAAGDPTRKTCFHDTATELIYSYFHIPVNSGPVGPPLAGGGNYTCGPWNHPLEAVLIAVPARATTLIGQFSISPQLPIDSIQPLSLASDSMQLGTPARYATIGAGSQTVHDVISGSDCNGPINSVQDYTDVYGMLSLSRWLRLVSEGGTLSGPWNADTITETDDSSLILTSNLSPNGPISGRVPISTYTSTITTGGIVTTDESAPGIQSANTPYTSIVAKGTLDLSTGAYTWARTVVAVYSGSCPGSYTETQTRTATLPIVLN